MLFQDYYADDGRPSIPPGRYARMLFIGQWESLDSEREICWRCADSLTLHRFLMLRENEVVPDHSTLSVTRSRLPKEVHDSVLHGWPIRGNESGPPPVEVVPHATQS